MGDFVRKKPSTKKFVEKTANEVYDDLKKRNIFVHILSYILMALRIRFKK